MRLQAINSDRRSTIFPVEKCMTQAPRTLPGHPCSFPGSELFQLAVAPEQPPLTSLQVRPKSEVTSLQTWISQTSASRHQTIFVSKEVVRRVALARVSRSTLIASFCTLDTCERVDLTLSVLPHPFLKLGRNVPRLVPYPAFLPACLDL